MDNLIRSGAKKIIGTVLTQVLVLGFSLITGFVLPKYMGPESFGYWQIYIFYISYLNLFGLGFNDGFALFYGGYSYEQLPFQRIRGGMRIFFIYLLLLTPVLLLGTGLFTDPMMHRIFLMLALNVPSMCLQCMVLTVFLSVNKTWIYNGINLAVKILSTMSFVGLLLFGITSNVEMMYAEALSRLAITLFCLFLGRKFLFGPNDGWRLGGQEFKEKSKAGFNITLGIIASTFLPVAGRVVVEHMQPIAVYGVYAFVTSLLTIIVSFANTAGMVVFPILKTFSGEKLPDYYSKLERVCSNLIYFAFWVYIPLVWIIRGFMPQYTSAFDYMHILLAMCLPLGKVQLLLISYYKAYRLERPFLIVNLSGAAAMLLGTYCAMAASGSVIVVAIVTTVIMTLWYAVAENFLFHRIGMRWSAKTLLWDLLFMSVFILAASMHSLALFGLIYGALTVIYLVFMRKKIFETFRLIRKSKSAEN